MRSFACHSPLVTWHYFGGTHAQPVRMPLFSQEIPFQMTPELGLATISFPFNNILASFRLSINSCVFINIPGGSVFNFPRPFVFIYIPGGSFIFNISLLGQLPPPGLERHMGETPRWAQAGIHHCLREHRGFVVRSHQDGVILGGSIYRDAP